MQQAVGKAESTDTYSADVDIQSGETLTTRGRIIGTIDGSRSRTTAQVTTDGETVSIELLQFGSDQFVTSRPIRGQLPAGKNWVRTEDETPSSQLPIGDFFRFVASSPSFEYLGAELVNGEDTEHFGGPLDLEELARQAGPDSAAAFEGLAGARAFRARLDLWIGPDRLPARMQVDLGVENGANDGTLRSRIDFVAFGVAAAFKKPKASETADPADIGTG